ncbi:MAG: hypothetical protein ACF8AM_09220 [Rhodopirellula sp. JB055]|uniref:hypothetical protein n=1 Tax=Rhodopirellula sp. JB055 TaxID=3342846 RepID=UPI00370ABBE8
MACNDGGSLVRLVVSSDANEANHSRWIKAATWVFESESLANIPRMDSAESELS